VEVLVFHLSGHRYGVCIADIREVLRAVTLAPLPKALAFVEGIINLRGDLVPVLDFRARFRLPSSAPAVSDHLVVASTGNRVVALRVDGAIDLITIDPEKIESPSRLLPGTEFVAGVAKLPDGLVLIHDLRTFLSQTEADALADLDAVQMSR
jgi:purine-binding chemotaxis protein CheW